MEKLDSYSKVTTATFCINFMANVARDVIEQTDDLVKYTPRLPGSTEPAHELETKLETLAEELTRITSEMASILISSNSFGAIDRKILQPTMDALNEK